MQRTNGFPVVGVTSDSLAYWNGQEGRVILQKVLTGELSQSEPIEAGQEGYGIRLTCTMIVQFAIMRFSG